jgi:mono/diheme cytochrome c family protein
VERIVILAVVLAAPACDWDFERMVDQPKFEEYEYNPYFPDGTNMQRPPAGTVARGVVTGPPGLVRGLEQGSYVAEIPVPLSRELVTRGRNRYEIFCAACHGVDGSGNTQVAENMRLRPPPSLHSEAIRGYAPGRLYQVTSEGYGFMPSYREELSVRDRWAVVAYVQALQLSQNVRAVEMAGQLMKGAQTWTR